MFGPADFALSLAIGLVLLARFHYIIVVRVTLLVKIDLLFRVETKPSKCFKPSEQIRSDVPLCK